MNRSPDIPANAIDIWYAYIDKLISSDVIENHLRVLSDAERSQLSNCSLSRVREESLAARLLIRNALSFYADVAPERWQFGKGRRGKPYVIAPWQDFHAFNIAHSANLVVFAIATDGKIGVDVESLDRATTGIPLARRFFAAQEIRQLLEVPPLKQRQAFLQIWTLKEAYIKAVGDGLAMPLDQFFFDFSADGAAHLHVHDALDSDTGWLFAQLRLPSRHHISLGINHPILCEKDNKNRVIVRAREFKSTQIAVPEPDVVCLAKNAWYSGSEIV